MPGYLITRWDHQDRLVYVAQDLANENADIAVADLVAIPGRFPLFLTAWVAEEARNASIFKNMYMLMLNDLGKIATLKREVFLKLDCVQVEEELFYNHQLEVVVVRHAKHATPSMHRSQQKLKGMHAVRPIPPSLITY